MTPDELRDLLLDQFRGIAKYWASLPDVDKATGSPLTILDLCEGVVFSILAQIDGCGMVLPAFDLVAHVHPDDEDQSLDGMVISDMLHEHFYNKDGGK